MELTSWPLLVLLGVLTVAVPGYIVWRYRRSPKTGPRTTRLVKLGASVLVAQLLAIVTVAAVANKMFGFYTSWADLFGMNRSESRAITSTQPMERKPITRVPVSPNNPHPHGLAKTINLPNAHGAHAPAVVWLPPQYFEASQAQAQFPVLLMIAGGRSNAPTTFQQMGSGEHELEVITRGKASPFIAVYMSNRYQPNLDVQCLDFPGQPGATWIVDDVATYVASLFRTAEKPQGWFVSGVSTGGFCAASLLANHPDRFAAGAGLAPYFTPEFDQPEIIPDKDEVVRQESLTRRAASGELKQLPFLSVMSTADTQSWGAAGKQVAEGQLVGDGEKFYQAAKHIPGTAFLIDEVGGHNFDTFLRHYVDSLSWLGNHGL